MTGSVHRRPLYLLLHLFVFSLFLVFLAFPNSAQAQGTFGCKFKVVGFTGGECLLDEGKQKCEGTHEPKAGFCEQYSVSRDVGASAWKEAVKKCKSAEEPCVEKAQAQPPSNQPGGGNGAGEETKITVEGGGLVPPCPGNDASQCGEAQLMELIVNIINFMIHTIAFPLVVLFFLIGGFLLLTSGGSPNRIERGKKAITGAVVGLIIVLTSVVVINTLLTFFTKCHTDKIGDVIAIGKIKCSGITN